MGQPGVLTSASNETSPDLARPRLAALDILRGLVMVLMALDHTRDFLTGSRFNPLDLTQTSTALFLTRWITHYCAPTFIFLAGTGAFLFGTRVQNRSQLATFLFTRGLWLVFLEFTLVHLGWFFNFEYKYVIGQTIWAIGWSMMLLSGLVFLPVWLVTLLGLTIIAGHNSLDRVDAETLGALQIPWIVFLRGGAIPLRNLPVLVVGYAVLPWLGVMMAGYGFGTLWLMDRRPRLYWLLSLGFGVITLFITIRWINGYGDPRPWTFQKTQLFTILSFLDCFKYPPSLDYVLMTLGPAILLLAWFDNLPVPLGRQFATFGRVPLFFYLIHMPLIHVFTVVFAWFQCPDHIEFAFRNVVAEPVQNYPPGYGYRLAIVYLIWVVVVLMLYPVCAWFAGVKQRSRSVWLSYL